VCVQSDLPWREGSSSACRVTYLGASVLHVRAGAASKELGDLVHSQLVGQLFQRRAVRLPTVTIEESLVVR